MCWEMWAEKGSEPYTTLLRMHRTPPSQQVLQIQSPGARQVLQILPESWISSVTPQKPDHRL